MNEPPVHERPDLARGRWLEDAARRQNILKIVEAAEKWGATRQRVSLWYAGEPIGPDAARAIAESLGVSPYQVTNGPWPALTPPLDAEAVARCVESVERLVAAVEVLAARVEAIEVARLGKENGRSA
jgi:hypothetical protein